MHRFRSLLMISALGGALGFGQEAAVPPGFVGETGGGGAWPAVAQTRGDLRTHTLYRPVNLPDQALPLLVWGNGGCGDNGLAHQRFLRDIASHGYIVIALGHPWASERSGPAADGANQDPTQAEEMTQAMDWAEARTQDPADELYGHIDPSRIAVAGHSCGGLQAIQMSAEPRIKTSMIFDSGVYTRPGGRSRIQVGKDALDLFHGPVLYLTGGPEDIAHENSVDDVSRIKHVPVYFAWLPVGHGGTFSAENGGDWADVAVKWLDWQLAGKLDAGRWFQGKDCRFCQDARWTVERYVEP